MLDRSKRQNDYDGIIDSVHERLSATDDNQPGNPASAVQRIIDAVCHEGPYSPFPELPLRIVLGSDAVTVMRSECNAVLRDLTRFEHIATSTDYEDSTSLQVAQYI